MQSEKAKSPIEVTLFGIVIEVRDSQWEKALLPILVTLFGIVIEVRDSQWGESTVTNFSNTVW